MQTAIGYLSVVPLRAEPNHRSEQVSQILFGDTVMVLEWGQEWSHVRCTWDGYEGWCRTSQLQVLEAAETLPHTRYLVAGKMQYMMHEQWSFPVSIGSSLPGYNNQELVWGSKLFRYFEPLHDLEQVQVNDTVIPMLAYSFMDVPYLWGGRSVFGIDCSGMSQLVFKMMGISILRDAWQQAEQGQKVAHVAETRCGDLAFFHNAKGRVNHVGIMLSNNTIIHATDTAGRVVVDKLDAQGIISARTGEHTHNLTTIQRYF